MLYLASMYQVQAASSAIFKNGTDRNVLEVIEKAAHGSNDPIKISNKALSLKVNRCIRTVSRAVSRLKTNGFIDFDEKERDSKGYLVRWITLKRSNILQISREANDAMKEESKMQWNIKKAAGGYEQIHCDIESGYCGEDIMHSSRHNYSDEELNEIFKQLDEESTTQPSRHKCPPSYTNYATNSSPNLNMKKEVVCSTTTHSLDEINLVKNKWNEMVTSIKKDHPSSLFKEIRQEDHHYILEANKILATDAKWDEFFSKFKESSLLRGEKEDKHGRRWGAKDIKWLMINVDKIMKDVYKDYDYISPIESKAKDDVMLFFRMTRNTPERRKFFESLEERTQNIIRELERNCTGGVGQEDVDKIFKRF